MRAIAFALLGVTLAAPAVAQDNANMASARAVVPDASASDSRVTIGVGAATVPDYEGSDDNRLIPAAAVNGKLHGFNFWSRGTQLYVDLIPSRGGVGTALELGAIGGARFNRTSRKSIDDRRVKALPELDTAWELGGFAGISRTGVITSDYDTLSARVAYLHDVSGTYHSYVLTPQINYTTPLSIRNLVSLGVSADYVGKGFGNYYFGVPAFATYAGPDTTTRLAGQTPLPAYSVSDSGWKNVNVSLFGVQSLSGDLRHGWGVGAGVLYSRLFGDYKRSPIVANAGSASQWSGAVGVTYTF